ncbi:hypothetical protein D5S18_15505 [Nocardia panacis]|uniref:Uncharacterized protein n=1 Tax=Nocardia panacis TaxID=2340916 RepID=A0A3A4KJM5_9NOCA|nr:tetratricopeptide repeat protein [Nocardia panacis]RJO74841.1 hypothetical protein D5S18_15505 [Nocardia panacis]
MGANWVPPWADPFLARADIMAAMADHVRRSRDSGTPARMYVHGLEGLGVSCLVTQFAKSHRDLIDGPLIWLNGRRPDGTAVPLGELLTRALRQFGIEATDQAATEAEKADTYRTICAGKRFILVLDDMDTQGQVFGLVPDDAPGAIVVATSALRRRGLESEGFEPFSPEALPQDAALTLFQVGLGNTEIDAASTAELVDLCGGFPLLIKVLAAQIRGRSARAPHLLQRLRKSRLALLEFDNAQRMTRFLDATYDDLADDQACAYRTLGMLPAATFSASAAAAVLHWDLDAAFAVLEALVELNLLTVDDAERYAFHPVIRDDARSRAEAVLDATARRRLIADWTSWYLRETLPRGAALSNRWWVRPVTDLSARFGGEYTRQDASAWFEIEFANIAAAIRAAHGNALPATAWPLCVAFWKYLHLHGLHDTWIETHTDGLAAARADHSDAGIMQLTSQLGAGYLAVGRFAEAHSCFTESHTAALRLGHRLGEQSALEWIGKTLARQGDSIEALDYFRRSQTVAAEIPQPQRDRALALLCLQRSRTYLDLADFDTARTEARSAQTYFDRFDNETDNRAKARFVIARALIANDDPQEALPVLREALELFGRDHARRETADTHRLIGRTLTATGQYAEAAENYRTALDYYTLVGNPLAASTAAALADLPDR